MAILNLDRIPHETPLSGVIKESKEKAVVNGCFVSIEPGTTVGDQELYDLKKLSDKCRIGIVAGVFHPYNSNEKEDDLVYAEGDVVRVYEPQRGNSFSVSKADCIQGAVSVGDKLKVNAASYKLTKDATGEAPVARVTRVYTIPGTTQESVRVEFL